MTISLFNIILATLGAIVAVSSAWGVLNIMRAYKKLQSTEGALLLNKARSEQKSGSDKKDQREAAAPSRLAQRLEKAGIPLNPAQWIAIQAALCTLVCGIIAASYIPAARNDGRAATVLLTLFAVSGILFGFRQFVGMRTRARLLLLEKQLAQVELQIAENARSGLPISRSILTCSELVDEPLRGYLKRMHAELTYSNITLADGFERIAERTGSSDARLLASVISVQQQTGSSLFEALGFLHETISRRYEMRQTLRSALAETKITRNIVAVTPWAIFLLLAFAPFVKIQGFWEFYSQNTLGYVVLGICAALELAILLLISRLSNLKLD